MFRSRMPAGIKRRVQVATRPVDRAWRRYLWRSEIARIGRTPATRRRMQRLALGWANDVWGADPDYLMLIAEHAVRADGPILECGSGVSTLVAAAHASGEVWALEHMPAWARRVQQSADGRGLRVRVCRVDLVDYGGFDWYQLPDVLPDRFGLVICDGPPADTRGGRFGLLPALGDRLAGATILLDDAHRSGERSMVRRWCREFGAELIEDGGRRAVLAL